MILSLKTSRKTVLAAALMSVSLTALPITGLSAQETHAVQADNGTIQVPSNPQRVVAIGNASLPFIDLGGTPIGVTAMSANNLALLPEDQQATFAAATLLGASGGEVDLEKLAALQPDLILAQFPGGDFEPLQERLEAIAPTVYFGLGTEWKAFADGLAAAANLSGNLDEQKAAYAAKLASIQETHGDLIANTSFVNLNRWASSDPGTFAIAHIGCNEIAKDEVGLNLPDRTAEGSSTEPRSFEQIGELTAYDVILYPADAAGAPTEPFLPVVETNAWQALPAVTSGHALGLFCPGNNSYGSVLRYLDSLDQGLASLPAAE